MIKKFLEELLAIILAFILSRIVLSVIQTFNKSKSYKNFKKGEVVRLTCLRFTTDDTGVIVESEKALMKISKVNIENGYQYLQFQDTDSDKWSGSWCRKLYWYEQLPVWKIKLKILYRSLFSDDRNYRIKYHDDDRVSRLLSRTEAKNLQQIYGGKVFIDFTNFKISDL